MRRIKRQALAVLGQQGLQFGQRSARACGHYQFAGLIADHAEQRPGVEKLTGQGRCMKVLAATTAQAQRSLVGKGGAYALGDLAKG
ncbi:hypothetical protein D3C81_2080670 [compost metagenome]